MSRTATRAGDHSVDQQMELCMQECAECAAICLACAHHCLRMARENPRHASPRHQAVMRDCADACAAAAAFMSRDSDYVPDLCSLCAELCERCADDCERLAEGDDMMERCAEACRSCAEACCEIAGD